MARWNRTNSRDRELRERAEAVIPGGMYGHQSAGLLPDDYPQFFERGEGAHIWDVDGTALPRLHVRLRARTCSATPTRRSTRPIVRQLGLGDTLTGPTGADGRAGRGHGGHGQPRRLGDVLQERHGRHHHGADHRPRPHPPQDGDPGQGRLSRRRRPGACRGPPGTIETDRANQIFCDYNDVASLEAAVAEAGDDLACIFAAPFKHDAFIDQAEPDPAYARRARELCDQTGALLVVDDVRAGLRLARDCSWSKIGVQPDLSTWGKCIANGHRRSRPCWASTRPARRPPRSSSPAPSGSRPRPWPRRWRPCGWCATPTTWSGSPRWASACAAASPSAPRPPASRCARPAR